MKTPNAPSSQPTPWTEKVTRLIGESGMSLRSIEGEANWPHSTLPNAISRKSDVGCSKALRLARVFGVPVEWLFDDTQPWKARPRQHPTQFDPSDPVFQFSQHVALAFEALKSVGATNRGRKISDPGRKPFQTSEPQDDAFTIHPVTCYPHQNQGQKWDALDWPGVKRALENNLAVSINVAASEVAVLRTCAYSRLGRVETRYDYDQNQLWIIRKGARYAQGDRPASEASVQASTPERPA